MKTSTLSSHDNARLRALALFACLAGFWLLLVMTPARAQNVNDGYAAQLDDTPVAMLLQPDGQLLVAGRFTQVNGQPRQGFTRLRVDGSLDPAFVAPPLNGQPIRTLAMQADGKILLGGGFTASGAWPRDHIARLNPDGTLDVGFMASANNSVFALAVQADGKILVGGWFTQINGQPRNYLARINADGSLDDSFVANIVGDGWFDYVEALAVQPDGKIVVGGYFFEVNGQPREHLARLNPDGSLDTDFVPPQITDGFVETLALQPDGKVLVGLSLESLSLDPARRGALLRLNADGSLDAGFNPRLIHEFGGGGTGRVSGLAVQPDGKVLAGGFFTQAGHQQNSFLVRLHADGTPDTAFAFGFGLGPDNALTRVAVQADGKVLIAGVFSHIGSQPREYLARLNANGDLDGMFMANTHGSSTSSIIAQPDGKVLIGGWFTQVNGQPRKYLARLNTDGSLDTGFAAPDPNSWVWGLALQPDGKLLVAGEFTQIGGQVRPYLARLNSDGTLDPAFAPALNNFVTGITLQLDGKILIGGGFTAVEGQARNHVARLHADGSLDTSFSDPGADNFPFTLIVQADGKVLMSGWFTQVSGQVRPHIARLHADGSLDFTFAPISNPAGNNLVMALQPDGKILVGGSFTQFGGQARNHIARLNPNGNVDAAFSPNANDAVWSFAAQPDGKVLVAGAFTLIGGQVRKSIARLNVDGSVDASFSDLDGNDQVLALAIQPDGAVLAGGSFSQIGGQARNGLARISLPEAARQSLSVEEDTVLWQRSGTGPELSMAPELLFSDSGAPGSFVSLGHMQRVPGGWSFDDFEPPAGEHYYLRVRGPVAGGHFNNALSQVETTVRLFAAPATHLVTPTVVGAGSITPNTPQTVVEGETVAFALSPDAGHVIASVTGCDGSLAGTTYTTGPVLADCTVVATFVNGAAAIFQDGFE